MLLAVVESHCPENVINNTKFSTDETKNLIRIYSIPQDEFIRLSQRLKEKYNLQEATVGLERCDKIWDTMQLLKKVQTDYGVDENESDEAAPGTAASAVPYIKYQPVQGNGNNALPNFYLAVKSQRKVYHCVTCGRHYSERRGLRQHSAKVHGIVLPLKRIKNRTDAETRNLRTRTPCELGSGGGRDSVEDDKTVQNSSKQISTDTEASLGDTIVDGKQADSTELNQLLGIVLECSLCSATFTNRKRLTKHSFDFHSMSVRQARKLMLMNRKLAASKRGTSGKSTATGRGAREATSSSESLSEASKSEKNTPPGKHGRTTRTIDGVKCRWQFSCKSCNKDFFKRTSLRAHALNHHNYRMPPCKVGGFLAAVKNSDLFKAELVKIVDGASKTRSGTPIRNKNNLSNKRKGAERPRRACALRTSYTECSKEEEVELQKTLAGISNSPPKGSPSQTTTCFLCKRSFVDIRKHLIDYHRINSPENVIPLKAIAEPVAGKNQISSEPAVNRPPTANEGTIANSRQSVWAAIEAGQDPRVNIVLGSNRQRAYQCAVCLYKYKHISTVIKHLKVNTVNGVLKDHAIYVRRSSNKRPEEKDPLALTDHSDASKSDSPSNCNTSEDDDSSSVIRKRITSSSNDRLAPSPEPDAKRRKIEDSETDVEPIGSESRSDCAEDNVEEESVIELSESDSRSVEEVKYPNDREARDSSDRDSGIGISITIKKRNDSYEVVGRDDTTTKEFENSKDDNDSSSDFSPVDFVSRDRETDRPCEIVNSIDCSKDEDVLGTMRTAGGDVEHENETKDRCTGAVADDNFHWKDERCREEAFDKARGNVPSLKVLSRTALTRIESSPSTTRSNEFSISHECPVCCRSCPTERDVTIHMLEHKVN